MLCHVHAVMAFASAVTVRRPNPGVCDTCHERHRVSTHDGASTTHWGHASAAPRNGEWPARCPITPSDGYSCASTYASVGRHEHTRFRSP